MMRNLVCLLLLVGVFTISCQSQEATSPQQTKPLPSRPSPMVVGTPPPLFPEHNPYNDRYLVSQYIRCIFQDSQGNYWFGPAGQSVVRYDGDTLRYFSKEAFFQGNDLFEEEGWNSVHAIAEDLQGNIWFGTDIGAVKYDGTNFQSYTTQQGLSNPKVGRQSILVDKAGTVWVGTQEGVFRYNLAADQVGEQAFSRFELLPPIQVKDILEDQNGNLWFASGEKGVFRYNPSTSLNTAETAITNLTEKAGLGNAYAGGIAEDPAGNLWFIMKEGISKYDGTNLTHITTEDGIGGSEMWGICIEDSGIIWITARGATTRFDPSLSTSDPTAFTVFTPADGLNCCVQSMYQDRLGNMWWGAGQGLYRFDGEHFYQVTQKGPW